MSAHFNTMPMNPGWGDVWRAAELAGHELLLFAAVFFALGALDELLVDLAWLRLRLTGRAKDQLANHAPNRPLEGIAAVLIPAWREAEVIGAMLRATLARLDHPEYRLYVGTYPNDRATIDAVAAVAVGDRRVRLVIGTENGPTTKADCLNTLWRALQREEACDGARAAAIVLHDAEDVVHPGELTVFDTLIGDYAVVQVPVLPLIDPAATLISGHYGDEFAEANCALTIQRPTCRSASAMG